MDPATLSTNMDLKLVVKHLVNGNLAESLCCICLQLLNGKSENIFTKICKQNKEYCIADVLEEVCNIKFTESDQYNVCLKCFAAASTAYRFYLLAKHNYETLNLYVNELENNLESISLPDGAIANKTDSICISLPILKSQTPIFDYSIDNIITQKYCDNTKRKDVEIKVENDIKTEKPEKDDEFNYKKEESKVNERVKESDDEEIVIVMSEDGKQTCYMPQKDGSLLLITPNKFEKEINSYNGEKKQRRKREPMTYKKCSQCPIKYRFIAKLKEHMKADHNISLFVCKICQALMENEEEFALHLKTHTNIYQCETCNIVFKKRDTIISHLKWHEEMKNMSTVDGANVCKVCGDILKDEEDLKDHCEREHNKKYTCYYCGRMYKGETGLNMHIKKHEMYMKIRDMKCKHNDKRISAEGRKQVKVEKTPVDTKFTCETCGRNFLGERALLWHNRLHTNERPFKCDVCGRGFVSLNRRNQHAVCAHTVPTRRCPLCPALFHLRSMVNTHIKKVHLKTHKRRNRTNRHKEVFWHTEPVPIQELSVSIQNEILELQAAKDDTVPIQYVLAEFHGEE
ncbi:zinc finger protein 57-like isoform X2 [Galleria mellonella]|uniref:Zinc finger protein 57-like isoform X2 n=1 Tax=Galleria mellonella TaxID=7137 RepID=A0A6J1X9G6_GALME|nr:zinc finger protein 57-like isoform X2 [Galleria mellonella]XP_031764897.2 zinc finger protein 57-like isoform X2 [Galleria mellonella]